MNTLSIFIFVGILLLLWKSFFPAYFREKGKNLATLEDIAKITEEVERVKSFYESQLKQLEHQIRSYLKSFDPVTNYAWRLLKSDLKHTNTLSLFGAP